jgi:membrane protease YdiL (CAAX protease family)
VHRTSRVGGTLHFTNPMPSPADDTLRMLQAGGCVAAAAVPVAVACGFVARRRLGSLCPRWRVPPFVWPGLAVFTFFVAAQLTPFFIPVLDQFGLYRAVYPTGYPASDTPDGKQVMLTLQANWANLISVPCLLFAAVMFRSHLFFRPVAWAKERRELPRTVALGVLGWATFGVLAFAINAGLTFWFDAAGWPVTEHPLSKMGASGDGVGGVLLVLSACVTAPLVEEFLYRGLLVPWAGGRWFRPWCLLFPAAVLAVMSGLRADGSFQAPAVAFVLVLAVGAYLIQRLGQKRAKFPTRTALAVWSSAALFAAAHSSVWPTPIPLFVLGLGLGYLAARTRSWAAGAVAHAAFNAVSTVWVFLRG